MVQKLLRNTLKISRSEKGQVLLEFGLVLVLVVAVAVGSLALFGSGIGGQYQGVISALKLRDDETATYLTIMNDFLDRVNAFMPKMVTGHAVGGTMLLQILALTREIGRGRLRVFAGNRMGLMWDWVPKREMSILFMFRIWMAMRCVYMTIGIFGV